MSLLNEDYYWDYYDCRPTAEQLDYESQIAMALRMSTQQPQRQEMSREELERREQEELEKILALSLVEK